MAPVVKCRLHANGCCYDLDKNVLGVQIEQAYLGPSKQIETVVIPAQVRPLTKKRPENWTPLFR